MKKVGRKVGRKGWQKFGGYEATFHKVLKGRDIVGRK